MTYTNTCSNVVITRGPDEGSVTPHVVLRYTPHRSLNSPEEHVS